MTHTNFKRVKSKSELYIYLHIILLYAVTRIIYRYVYILKVS